MLKLLLALVVGVVPLALWFVSRPSDPSTLPKLNLQQWWGPEELKGKADDSIRPFKIEFTDKMIEDLKKRLDNFRPPPPPLEGVAQSYGFNSKLLEDWRRYWRDQYPFKAREAFLNQFPQFKTNIQGLDVHFIHVKPKVPAGVKVLPLLALHGWPGSVVEFYESIPLLARQAPGHDFAFEVIVPSLPGYGFSDAAVRPGLGCAQAAVLFRNLMHRLGHKQFYMQGGDMGSLIGTNMVTLFPDEVLGFHSNMLLTRNARSNLLLLLGALYPPLVVPAHQAHRMYPLGTFIANMTLESGYFHMHATKPDTLGVSLSDSPLGLLAYIFEKFSTGTRLHFRDREDGGLLQFYSREQLLDNVMVYWVSNAKTTAMRMYAETFNKAHTALNLDSYQTTVPTWALQAINDFYHPPTLLRTKFVNLLGHTELPDGGHFIALEKPEVFSQDVFKAVKEFVKYRESKKKTEL
ncbi:juvenile hormone epoxide hydrolase-like [Leguminivora glycinivorella]|uniref:juvenile hormone epoxide hydrolase-like n=1 Tax=Leguminivora glycinivorella TaxID=1035111 RepID=UPI0020107B24|nr:juvenile hormone epoxide hydrolase-like [Leguminivora glycinivorella]